MDHDYLTEYEEFMNRFKLTEVSGEEVGVLVMRMAHYFAKYNVRYANALRAFRIRAQEISNTTDATTGKAITAAKAEVAADSTEEAAAYELARVHVQNIEQAINALKALQRGVLQEYANSN